MKKRLFIISLITCLFVNLTFSQKEVISNAKKDYDKLSYVKTTEQLLELAENGNTSIEVLGNLANAYYFNNKMEAAAKWYKILLGVRLVHDSEFYFRYAHALKALENYSEADQIMIDFSWANPLDSRAILFNDSKGYLKAIEKLSSDFALKNLEVNTSFSDFGTSTNGDNLIFASTRDQSGKVYTWNEQPFLNLFELNTDNSINEIIGDVNTKYHESSTAFTKDGNTMYFTRNNFFNGKFKKNKENTHGLKIYKASLVGGKWSNIESLPFNSDDYNVAHPALSVDDKKLYFASDMPGTKGGSDIFEVSINGDGTYGVPSNLGSKINTEGRENFPFISDNGTLYFSSDGHVGLGSLDVFKMVNDVVYNLGKPINSPNDDFGYIINEQTREGYITSNRAGGKGDDDIYSFIKNECAQNVTGIVVDKETTQIIANANVTIVDSDANIILNLLSDEDGAFSFKLGCENNSFKATGTKETYLEHSANFVVYSKQNGEIELKLTLTPEPQVAEIGTDLFKLLNLNPIYFDHDKSFIRADAEIELTKIINYMKEFPNVKVDVRSHTDSKGRDDYNLGLSNRRNKLTRDYIINDGGISSDRLSGKGYGEMQLINRCSNGVICSEKKHQANRRSQFIVVEN